MLSIAPKVVNEFCVTNFESILFFTSQSSLFFLNDGLLNSKMLLRVSFLLHLVFILVAGKKNVLPMNHALQSFIKKPIILLDVDSVINISYHKNPKTLWEDITKVIVPTYMQGHAVNFQVTYSPTVIQKINEWNKIAEVRWLTSWNNRAITFMSPALGLEPFKLAEGRESNDWDSVECEMDKTESAIATAKEVGPGRCVIWIDDELKLWKEFNSKRVLLSDKFNKPPPIEDAEIFSRPNTVLLSPRYGLTKDHVTFVDNILTDPELSRGKLVLNLEEGARKC